jgi:hypothetical protein
VRRSMRVSLVVLLLLGADFIGITQRANATQSAAQSAAPQAASTQQATATPPVPTDPRALYEALNALRPDAARAYSVKDLTLRRDVVSFTFSEGELSFLEPLGGRITGAFFSGRGHVIATPHERGERRSLAHFIGVPILDQSFSEAYIRFTDDTATELQRQLAADGIEPTSDPKFTAHWNPLAAGLAPTHSLRTMVDWLAAEPVPYFYILLQTDAAGAVEVSASPTASVPTTCGHPSAPKILRPRTRIRFCRWIIVWTQPSPRISRCRARPRCTSVQPSPVNAWFRWSSRAI